MAAKIEEKKQPGLGARAFRRGAAHAQGLNQQPDSIAAMVKPGEFVLPPDTVHAVGGARSLQKIVDSTHTPVSPAAARGVPPQFRPEMFFANGGLVDEERKRPNSFGDAAAAARDPGVTQMSSPAVSQPSDAAQIASDRAAAGRFGSGFVSGLDNMARAAGDIAGLPVRGVAGALDTAVVRPLRAAGVDVGYLSPHLVPPGADPASMTPFTDQKRQAAGEASAPFAASPAGPAATPAAFSSAPSLASAEEMQNRMGAISRNSPAAPAGGAPSATTSNNVIRDGNSYSGANISGDITINGRAPGGGSVSAQNMAAADALGARPFMTQPSMAQAAGIQAPMVRSSLNDWQMRNELRNAEVSANSITNNGGRFDRHGRGVVSPAMLQYQSLLKSDQALRSGQPTADIAAMRENAGLQREGMQQAGANQRSMWQTAVDQRRLKMDETTRGFTDRAAQQQEQLRSVLLDPKATPEQRQQAQQALLAISGKQAADPYLVVPGGQQVDEMGRPYNMPSSVFNRQTGQFVSQSGAGGQQALPQVGAVQGGYRFKGGDPSRQSSWEKA